MFIFLLSLSGTMTSISPPLDGAAKACVSTTSKTKNSEVDRKWGFKEPSSNEQYE